MGLVVVYMELCYYRALLRRTSSRAWLWGLMMGRKDPFEFS